MSARTIGLAVTLLLALTAAEPAAARQQSDAARSYYPHWAFRQGELSEPVLRRLEPGTIIGVHHGASIADLRRILDVPGKRFQIAWYVESNVVELDDAAIAGTPVADRIGEAGLKQAMLSAVYGDDRFADLIELDAAREKKEGNLEGEGNRPEDWLRDAAAVKAAGFRYLAKSPQPAHVRELRTRFGDDFVARMVFEDVTAGPLDDNPGYRRDARALAAKGEIVTLVIHEGEYGGFPATSFARAWLVVDADFRGPNVEAYWGRAEAEDGFAKIKHLGASAPASALADAVAAVGASASRE